MKWKTAASGLWPRFGEWRTRPLLHEVDVNQLGCYECVTESCFTWLPNDLHEFVSAPPQMQAKCSIKWTETPNPASVCPKEDLKRCKRPNHKYIDTQFYLENFTGMENKLLLLVSVCLPLFVVSRTVGKLWFP